jgi:cytochrome c551
MIRTFHVSEKVYSKIPAFIDIIWYIVVRDATIGVGGIRMKKWIVGSCLALVVGVALITGCSGNEPAKVDKQSEGYKIFSQNCSSCHGADLQGGAGPNLAHVGSDLSKDAIAKQIQRGGAGMPAFQKQLDSATIEKLADWLSQVK